MNRKPTSSDDAAARKSAPNVVPIRATAVPVKRARKPVAPKELPSGVRLASDYKVKTIRWLWQNRIALGKITILEGDPGRGKSTLTVDWAARVSTGRQWPSDDIVINMSAEQSRQGRGVVMVCAEDDWEDTLVPRLVAAGADLHRIASITPKRNEETGQLIPLTFPRDLNRIDDAVRAVKALLVVIDPIMAYLSDNTNSNNDQSVRKALLPLQALAARRHVAIVLVRHFNKNGDLKAEYRGGGSIAFSAAARSLMMAERHPEESGLLCLANSKNNLALEAPMLTYRIVPTAVTIDESVHDMTVIEWEGSIDMDLRTLMRGHDARRDAPVRGECVKEIQTLLAEQDPRPAEDMKKLLAAA